MATSEGSFYAVDRVEGEQAVVFSDGGEEYVVPLAKLPAGTREGTIIRVGEDAAGAPAWPTAWIDEAEARRRSQEVEDILRDLRGRDPGGDVQV